MWFFKKRPRFEGLTIGVCFKSKDGDSVKKKYDLTGQESKEGPDFNNYIIEQILQNGGLVTLVKVDFLPKLFSNDLSEVLITVPHASLILFGNFVTGIYSDSDTEFYCTTFRCVTRNSTIIGSGQFYTLDRRSNRIEESARKVLEGIKIESFKKIITESFDNRFVGQKLSSITERA